jgi:hypothetical protein
VRLASAVAPAVVAVTVAHDGRAGSRLSHPRSPLLLAAAVALAAGGVAFTVGDVAIASGEILLIGGALRHAYRNRHRLCECV